MRLIRENLVKLICLVVLGLGVIAYANSPYPPWVQQIGGDFTIDPNGIATVGSGAITSAKVTVDNSVGTLFKKSVRYIYDVAVNGGSTTAHTLNNASLPAGAIITSSYYNILTAFSAATSAALMTVDCEDAGNVVASVQISPKAAGINLDGTVPANATAGQFGGSAGQISAACNLTATVGLTALSAGKLVGTVEYFLAQ